MRESLIWVLGLIIGCFAAISRADLEAGVPAADLIQARWDARNLPFAYAGITTRYSCPALEDKIRNIVLAVGGHPSTRVRASGCQGGRPARTIRVDILTAVPRPAAEPKDSRVIEREKLLERFGVPNELKGEFPARQRRVSLASQAGVRIAAGDCELLTQLRDQVFPKLGVTVEKNNLSCSPNRLSSATPRLNVIALLPSSDALKQ